MKRTYRISVTVEATFSRKIESRQYARAISGEVSRSLDEFKLEGNWKVVGAKVTSKAVSDAKPKVILPNPKQVARDELVAGLQVHAEGMARLLGNVVKPRLLRHPSRVCWGGMRGHWAHAHVTNRTMYRVSPGKRAVRLGNLYGTICLGDRFLDQILAAPAKVAEMKRVTGISVLPADGLDTIAHEVAHLRVPKRAHSSAKFHEVAERLEREYREVLAGTRSLPSPRPFGRFNSTVVPETGARDPSYPKRNAVEDTDGPRSSSSQAVTPVGNSTVDTSLSAPTTDTAVRESPRSASSLSVVSSDGDDGRMTRPAGIDGAGWRTIPSAGGVGPGEAQADDPAPTPSEDA